MIYSREIKPFSKIKATSFCNFSEQLANKLFCTSLCAIFLRLPKTSKINRYGYVCTLNWCLMYVWICEEVLNLRKAFWQYVTLKRIFRVIKKYFLFSRWELEILVVIISMEYNTQHTFNIFTWNIHYLHNCLNVK